MFSQLLAFFRRLSSKPSPLNGSSTPQGPASLPVQSPPSSTNASLPTSKPPMPPSKPLPKPLSLLMPLTVFQQATGLTQKASAKWYGPICDACIAYGINTPLRLAGFLAQTGHESMGFVHTKEIWGPTKAQQRYDTRADLGNTTTAAIIAATAANKPVGLFYRGHGLIQVTGFDNHKRCGEALGIDCVNHPDLLSTDQYAALSAAWFWHTNGLNAIADRGDNLAMSRAINLGDPNSKHTPNGMLDRNERYARAKLAFGLM